MVIKGGLDHSDPSDQVQIPTQIFLVVSAHHDHGDEAADPQADRQDYPPIALPVTDYLADSDAYKIIDFHVAHLLPGKILA